MTIFEYMDRLVGSMLPPLGTVPQYSSCSAPWQKQVRFLGQHRVLAQICGQHTQIKISGSRKRRRGDSWKPIVQGRCRVCASKSPPKASKSTVMCKECGIMVCRDLHGGERNNGVNISVEATKT